MVEMWRRLACVAVLGSCLLLAACAGPVPGYGAYRHAALQTAMAMVSDLASGQLAGQLGLQGKSFSVFTDGNVTNAENDADSVNSTFASRQPPAAGRATAVSLVLQMVTGISYLIWVPLARLDGRHVDGGGAVLIVLTGFRGRGLCSVRQRLTVRRPGGLRTGPGPASRCLPGAGSWTLARSVSQTYRHGSGPAAEGHVSGTFVMPLNARPSAGRVL
jgi:hypothetical protein